MLVTIAASSAGANICSPSSRSYKEENAQLLEALTNVARASADLRQQLEHSSLDQSKAPATAEGLKLQLKDLQAKIQTQSQRLGPIEGQTAIKLYFASLDNLAAADLMTQPTTSLYASRNFLNLPINKFKEFALNAEELAGINVSLDDKAASLGLNAESAYFAELYATAQPRSATSKNKIYFQTLKCVLNRLSLQKKIGLSQMLGEQMSLGLAANTRACNRLTFWHVRPPENTQYYESRKSEINKLVNSSLDLLTKTEAQAFEKALKTTPFLLNDLFVLSVDDITAEFYANQNPYTKQSVLGALSDFDRALSAAETRALKATPILNDILDAAAIAAKKAWVQTLSCKYQLTEDDLTLAENVLRRILIAQLSTFIKNNSLIAFAKPEHFQSYLKTTLSASIERLAETAGFLFTAWGYVSFDDKDIFDKEFLKVFSPALSSELAQITQLNAQIKSVSQKSHESQKAKILQNYPQLSETALKVSKIMDTKTPRSELEFNSAAIAKLFAGQIDGLAAPFNDYVTRILTRKDWAAQKSTWLRYKQQIQSDISANKYKCTEPSTLSSIGQFFGSLFNEATMQEQKANPNTVKSQSCAFTLQLAKHLGLDLSSAPKNLQTVWPSFTKNYDEADNKEFEKRYRDFLKTLELYAYPLLDFDLSQIVEEVKTEYPLYAYLSTDKSVKSKNAIITMALRATDTNLTNDIIKVTQANKLSDLNEFVKNANGVNQILGAKQIGSYIPSTFSEQDGGFFPSVYNTHINYQNQLIRRNRFEYKIREESLSRALAPMYWLGAGALLRFSALRLSGKAAVGSSLYTVGESSAPIISGYFSTINLMFAGAGVNSYAWERNINDELELIEKMKGSDYIVYEGGEPPLLSYEDYITQKYSLTAERSDVRFQKWLYTAFAGASLVFASIEPIMSARAARIAANPKTIKPPKSAAEMSRLSKGIKDFQLWSVARGIKIDKLKLSGPLKWLGNPSRLDVTSLQAAKQTSKHKLAEEGYRRVIFTLGSRINQRLGDAAFEKKMAEALFGNSGRISELHALSKEYHRLFPDLVVRGLR